MPTTYIKTLDYESIDCGTHHLFRFLFLAAVRLEVTLRGDTLHAKDDLIIDCLIADCADIEADEVDAYLAERALSREEFLKLQAESDRKQWQAQCR